MRRQANPDPVPLPDAEAIERCIIERAIPAIDRKKIACSFSACLRVLHWAVGADDAGLDLLVMVWPDKSFCFTTAPCTPAGAPPLLASSEILAAYRHALGDPHAQKLFHPMGEHVGRGLS